MILYGISGTNGSGKDSLGEYLAKEYNFLFVSVTDLLREEAKKRGLPVERENLREISAEWRRESGLGVLVDKAVELFNNEGGEVAYAGLVMASLRNPGEADRIHELDGKMIWLDANPLIRYERIVSADRGRGDKEASHTFEQFLAEQEAEMKHSGDHATLSMADVKERCDICIANDSNDIDEFHGIVSEELGL
jgi:cytidylate kinase